MMQAEVAVVKPSDVHGSEQLLQLDQLTEHEALRARALFEEGLSAQWSAKMRALRDGRVVDGRGQPWPPLLVVSDGQTLWLVDGYHRLYAAQLAGLQTFQATVFEGDLRDAQERSLSANLLSERKRTNEDKRLIVRRALLDSTWRALSDARVAELCGVSQPFVSKLRRELIAAGEITQLAERLGADGRVYQASKISGRTPGMSRSKLSAARTTHIKKSSRRHPRPQPAPSPLPAPKLTATPPIIRKREPTSALDQPAASPAPSSIEARPPRAGFQDAPPTTAALRDGDLDPGSLRLLVAPALERRHWYDVANDGVPLLNRSSGVLIVPQTRDLPHAVSHLIRQNISYLGLAMLQDGSAWHLWGFDESIQIPAARDLPELCATLNPLRSPWLVYAP